MIIKRIILSLVVLGIFVIYSLGIRHQLPTIGKPASVKNSPSQSTASGASKVNYKNGTYTGDAENAYYGNVKVSVMISGSKISSVKFLDYPTDHPTSTEINQQAAPLLQQEAIKAQSAKVQIISGATFTSQAFAQSLDTALSQAKA